MNGSFGQAEGKSNREDKLWNGESEFSLLSSCLKSIGGVAREGEEKEGWEDCTQDLESTRRPMTSQLWRMGQHSTGKSYK